METVETKTCTKCDRVLPLSEFNKGNDKYGLSYICKGCVSIKNQKYRNKPGVRDKIKDQVKSWHAANKNAMTEYYKEHYLKNKAYKLVRAAYSRAKRKGIPFTLTADDVAKLQNVIDAGRCELTGMPLSAESHKANSPSLDQIKAGEGYTKDNVRVVCRAVNNAMGTWGEEAVWEMFQHWAAKKRRDKRNAKKVQAESQQTETALAA